METPPTPRPSAAAEAAVNRPRRGTARRLALPAALAVTVLFSACQADTPTTSTPATSTPASGAATGAASPTQPTPSPAGSSAPPTPRPSAATRKPSSPAADTTIAVVIADGKVSPNAENVRVKEGQTVQVTITSDVDESIHVHGYDQTAEASAGKPGAVTFTADVKGVFEIETHESAQLVAKLIVS
jgi:FtsP/CotA-like multicopper oxidase with cupredoxin domain